MGCEWIKNVHFDVHFLLREPFWFYAESIAADNSRQGRASQSLNLVGLVVRRSASSVVGGPTGLQFSWKQLSSSTEITLRHKWKHRANTLLA